MACKTQAAPDPRPGPCGGGSRASRDQESWAPGPAVLGIPNTTNSSFYFSPGFLVSLRSSLPTGAYENFQVQC